MDNQNSYTIMLAKIKAHRYTKDIIAASLSSYNVTGMEWLLLGAVDKQPLQSTTTTNLAQELQVSTPLISRFTKSLEEKGLITVKQSREDKRWRDISLSSKGQAMIKETEPIVREALRVWLSPIKREHVDIYINVLLQVAYKL